MSTNTDDVDDEYLDDPISLLAIEVKKEICNEVQIIDIESSSDEEEVSTSGYGKKNFVLPVTFFDNSRNVRLLNKCKPMSISIVNCKQYPTYYTIGAKKSDSKVDESSIEIDNKNKCDSEHKPNSADAQNVVIKPSITLHEADKKKEGKKKRRGHRSDSYYEKLKKRKENSKQSALNCKDLSQVDFKRNTGLVGLKITDIIFKQIINTEKALVKTKKSAENKSKKSDENSVEIPVKNKALEEKCKKTFSVVEKVLSVVKRIDTKSKENKESEKKKEPVVTKSIDCTKDKFKKINDRVVERALTTIDLTCVENQCKKTLKNDAENTLFRTSITSVKNNSKEKSENNMYIKEVGAALDNLGTSIIPVTDNHTNNGASNNVTVTDNIENKSIKTHNNSAAIIDKLRNNNDIEMRCSLKIPSKKIVEKLKLKEVKSINKHVSNVLKNTIVQQSPTETITNDHTLAKFYVNPNKPSIDGSYVVSDKDALQCKSMDVAFSRDMKQLEKPVARNASRNDKPGPNSPVLPCNTITVRPGPPKSSQNIPNPKKNTFPNSKRDNSTAHITPPTRTVKDSLLPVKTVDSRSISNAQKPSEFPKIVTMNKIDISNNSSAAVQQPAVVAQTKVKATSDSKDTSNSTQNSTSNLKTLKVTEYEPPNNYPFAARLNDNKSNISAPNLADQNMLKLNLTKEVNQVKTPIKSATFSGNTIHINNQTTKGLINNQTCSNPEMSPSRNPKFSGNNAIIFRRPPPPPSRDFQNNTPPDQGRPIQTVINYRPQFQVPHGSTPMRFCLPPPYPPPPPNYPPLPYNYASPPNLAQIRSNQIRIPQSRMSSTHLRGIEMGLNHLRFPCPRPPGCRPPLQIPPLQDNMHMYQGPQSPQVNNDSCIGNTAYGDPIKKINIPSPASVTDTVNDKQMMLAELNNAVMSPELTANKPEDKSTNDLKRKADPKAVELAKPKYSKPCPLSKKVNVATDLNKEKIPDKALPNFGYSPPILPIMTYEESFQKFQNDTNIKKGVDTQHRTPSRVRCSARIMRQSNKKQKITHTYSGKHDKAKKITFEDYRKRSKDGARRIDVDKIRKHNESKNVTDDYNQDLGYDSDSTVKLFSIIQAVRHMDSQNFSGCW